MPKVPQEWSWDWNSGGLVPESLFLTLREHALTHTHTHTHLIASTWEKLWKRAPEIVHERPLGGSRDCGGR